MPEKEDPDAATPFRPATEKERSRSSERGKKPPRQPLPPPTPRAPSATLEPDDAGINHRGSQCKMLHLVNILGLAMVHLH
eukprot:11999687-Prorocentrum_lima.AAC.1